MVGKKIRFKENLKKKSNMYIQKQVPKNKQHQNK